MACAAANATIDVIEEEGLLGNSQRRGAQLMEGGSFLYQCWCMVARRL